MTGLEEAGTSVTMHHSEVLAFIEQDQTDKNQYIPDKYVCWNFAADIKMNAFKADADSSTFNSLKEPNNNNIQHTDAA